MQTKVVRIVTALIVLVALVALCAPLMAQAGQGGGGGQGRGGGQGGGGGQGRGGAGGGGGRGGTPPIIMTTTAFEDGGVIPAKFVGGMGVSPELKWSNVPMGTQSFVLLMHDPDVSLGGNLLDVTH